MSLTPSLTTQRLELAVYLAHIRLGNGGRRADWAKVRYCCDVARQLLRRYLVCPHLADELTVAAHQASEALRTQPDWDDSWNTTRTHAVQVVPVALRVLSVLCNRGVS